VDLDGKLLRRSRKPCYGFRLKGPFVPQLSPVSLSNRKVDFCLEHFSRKLLLLWVGVLLGAVSAWGQTATHPAKAELPPEDEIWYRAVQQESSGGMRYLRGSAVIQLTDVKIMASTI